MGDEVHRDRFQVVFHVAYREDNKFFVDVDVGRLVDKARPRALGVFGKALRPSISLPSMPASTSSKSD